MISKLQQRIITCTLFIVLFLFSLLYIQAIKISERQEDFSLVRTNPRMKLCIQEHCIQPMDLTHLIMVACHSIYFGSDLTGYEIEDNWTLDSYQKGTLSVLLTHLRRGIEEGSRDNTSLVVFSGGQTHSEAGPKSEASSYWSVANHQEWYGFPNVKIRTAVEEYARDSFENLLFSICRFHQITGRYPTKITVIGFEFKKKRFVELHRTALGYPLKQFHYIGINGKNQGKEVVEGERRNALIPFQSDPYGCFPPLVTKKLKRDVFQRYHPYGNVEGLQSVLHACDGSTRVSLPSW